MASTSPPWLEVKSRLIEHHVMAGALHAQPHAQLGAREQRVFQAQPLKVVQTKRLRDSARFRWIFNRLGHCK